MSAYDTVYGGYPTVDNGYDSYDYQGGGQQTAVPLPRLVSGPTVAPNNPMNDWGAWAQGIAGTLIGAAVQNYQYGRPASRVPAVGPDGRPYVEGQRVPTGVSIGTGGGFTITPMMLLLGGVAAFLVLRK